MMRQPLMWALAAVLGVTLWLANQSDDDRAVEPVRRESRAPAGPAERRPEDERASSAQPRSARSAAGAGARVGAGHGDEVRLLQAVARWQQRHAGTPSGPERLPGSAWRGVAPPPPPPVSEAPPPPQAPPFPHRWLGRYQDAQAGPQPEAPASSPLPARMRQRAIIAGPVSTWVVAEGELIEGQWRVDRIDERSLRLTYLPLMQQQTLTMR